MQGVYSHLHLTSNRWPLTTPLSDAPSLRYDTDCMAAITAAQHLHTYSHQSEASSRSILIWHQNCTCRVSTAIYTSLAIDGHLPLLCRMLPRSDMTLTVWQPSLQHTCTHAVISQMRARISYSFCIGIAHAGCLIASTPH
jgi:hypothetical protein